MSSSAIVQIKVQEPRMKTKKPASPRVRRGPVVQAHQPDIGGRAIVLDYYKGRIEAFNREQGGGVAVRKDQNGYTLIRDDTGHPLARLRPLGTEDSFEVLCWVHSTQRWRKVGEFGGMILPLDDALDFIAEDPMDCFWT